MSRPEQRLKTYFLAAFRKYAKVGQYELTFGWWRLYWEAFGRPDRPIGEVIHDQTLTDAEHERVKVELQKLIDEGWLVLVSRPHLGDSKFVTPLLSRASTTGGMTRRTKRSPGGSSGR